MQSAIYGQCKVNVITSFCKLEGLFSVYKATNLHQLHCDVLGSIVVSISACHAEDPGSIPGRGVSFFFALSFFF